MYLCPWYSTVYNTLGDFTFGPIANLKGPYFQPSLSACACACLWPALLPFNVDRFWWNLVTRTLLWSSSAAEGPCNAVWKFQKKSQKSQNSNFKILRHHFLRLCLLCTLKKIWLDSNKTDARDNFDFSEVCPYGDSGNGTAAAARCSAGYSEWTGEAAACSNQSSEEFGTGAAIGL